MRAEPADDPKATARDEVDRLVAAWRAARPELDPSPLEVLSRVSRLSKHLDRARQRALDGEGLDLWEFDVLVALRRAAPPHQLSPGALLHATMVTSGTMTNRIDRLTERGLVARRPDPEDGRGVLVRLTPRGRERADGAMTGLLERERELLAELDPDAQTALARLLRRLLLSFDG
ncbi:MAG: MarR family winged helix-turn-helix transcriptional regulator [Candidatus Dormibacteraceae bacterium]